MPTNVTIEQVRDALSALGLPRHGVHELVITTSEVRVTSVLSNVQGAPVVVGNGDLVCSRSFLPVTWPENLA